MKRFRVLGLLVVAITAAVSLTASPAHADTGPVVIENFNDALCLQPAGDSVNLGTSIVQEFCLTDPTQSWVFHSLGGSSYRVENAQTHLCLDAFGGAANGTPVVQWTCANISNQKWDAIVSPFQTITLVSQVAGTHTHCLDVPGAQDTLGLAMQLFACNNTEAQVWALGISSR
jgi:hypothetical protein